MSTRAAPGFIARRHMLRAAVAAGALLPLGAALGADGSTGNWPNRPLRLICPLGAGTSADTLARLVAHRLHEQLGQSVIVENRAGAATNIASEMVARAAPDGYTLLLGTSSLTILPATIGARALDPAQAFVPLAMVATQPLVIAAHPTFGGNSFADVVRMAKEQPDTIAFSTSGIGGGGHLAAAWAMSRAGIRMVHVPYTASRALTDVLSGQVPLAFSFPGTVLPMIRAGQLKGIGVTSLERLPAAPDIPTLAESGLPGFEVMNWQGLLAPAGTPHDIAQRLQRELAIIVATPEVRERLRGIGFEPLDASGERFAQVIREETVRWKNVVAAAGLRFE